METASSVTVCGVPHPRLRAFVAAYTGYRLSGFEPGVHVGLPSGSLTFVISFDEPVEAVIDSEAGDGNSDRYWGLLGGLHATPARITHSGNQHGVQLAITPQGAATLFGVPAGELASSILHLEQVMPAVAHELVDRLSSAETWRARWATLDEVLLRALRTGSALSPELLHAWDLLQSSGGAMPIGEVAGSVGWSRRHLSQQFRRGFGLSPKVMSRVIRFERAQKLLRLPTQPSLSSVAAVCGYADQAHMTREWQEFAGSSPTAWLLAESLPFVQDNAGPAEAS